MPTSLSPSPFRARVYLLANRTRTFAADVRVFTSKLHRSIASIEDIKQLVRASGSVGANYLEADESVSKKDFIHRLKICRKEARESVYWLQLLNVEASNHVKEQKRLIEEANQLVLIFHASIAKAQKNLKQSIAAKHIG